MEFKMKKDIYAHSANKKGKWQILEEHLNNVAAIASDFAKEFNSSEWAYNIGLLHDIGKASEDFQEYLQKSANIDSDEDGGYIQRTNHSGAGAIFSMRKYNLMGKVLAYCIAGHHAGLANWYLGVSALSLRIGDKGNGRDNKYFDEQVKEYAEKLSKLLKNDLPQPQLKNCLNDLHLWIKMLYSCLVDADFLDTEKFLDEEKYYSRSKFDSISKLSDKFFKYMADKINKADKTKLNKIRKDIFDYCKNSAGKNSGFFELAVPTGGGKTLSAMAFAFEHAVKYNKNRIIYVIPYTSIIEQTSKILKDILGSENVVEHHSNIDPDKETESSRLACENWDAPIIVTTNVQFFESLYANKSSKCRKLHNIANSVIILDEAQMLPLELLYPCIDILKQLVNNYKTTILFSTATAPYLPEIERIEKIIPDSMKLYDELKRVNYNFRVKDSVNDTWESIADKIKQYKQVLCVVNTRRDCYDLHKLMPKGTIHLSALMCAQHRSKIIAEIKERLKNKEEIRVVSTQLVEAGVDIDFPIVYRAFAGLPSIIQTAGRCNREGKAEKGEVFIFKPPNAIPAGLMRKSADVTKDLMRCDDFVIDSAEISKKFFEYLIVRANSTGDKEYKKDLVDEAAQDNFEFSSYSDKFNIIDDKCSKPIIVKYDKSEELISTLRYAGISKDLMRKLQRYTVNIPPNKFKEIQSKGLIEEIQEGIFAQDAKDFYSEDVGLNVFDDKYGITIEQI
jgi:CRISPR-associated endonuclease/helicase Cas3